MSFLHEEYGTDAEIYRKQFSTEVIADSSNAHAHRILKECGFTEKSVPPLYLWHELPTGLGEEEEKARSTRAVCLLRAAGLDANIDEALLSPAAHAAVLTEIHQVNALSSRAAASSSPASEAHPRTGTDAAASPTPSGTPAPATRGHRR
ncbi:MULTISPECIES: hypothetical protein [unclassified Streptomyces]|uniref:hypothetical protein n=1 Tax=unclassified Streptomyces TaxID=2593676 RepID=UPI00081D9F6F|nr:MULTISPECIES: hypothetical protein [unclassified Streptomyces]MYZ34208.1 hypothetical protein [Streptomyces sp. SID4917]SCF65059.1 hypothetical protein GA0115259_1006516 [Streptomyces sp. MnatMP-M17]